jgi:hypothetical protein
MNTKNQYSLIEPVILINRTATNTTVKNMMIFLEVAEYQNDLNINKVADLNRATAIIEKSINQN